MNYTLIVFEADWADEHSVYGFRLTNKNKEQAVLDVAIDYFFEDLYEDFDSPELVPEDYIRELMKSKKPKSQYFGTNQEIEFDSFEDYQRYFEFVELSEEQAAVIAYAFNQSNGTPSNGGVYSASFGWMPCY